METAPTNAAIAIAPFPASEGAPKAGTSVLAAPLPARPRITSQIHPQPPRFITRLMNPLVRSATTIHITNISRFK